MVHAKRLSECENNFEINMRLKILRENIVKCSEGILKYCGKDENDFSIYVDWNWINRIEIRNDSSKGAIVIEIWIADVKHQWNSLSKKSSMKFLDNKENKIDILGSKAQKTIGAYIKFGDTFGNTLKCANVNQKYVMDNFNKQTYKNFYKRLGGQWKLNSKINDYEKSDLKLLEEIKKMELDKDEKNEFIAYVEEEIQSGTRNILNMSLGTTIKTFISIKDLQEKDKNFNYEKGIDELALPICNLILEYKNQIEEK